VPEVNERNCFNSTSIKISDVAILGSQELPSACIGLDSSSTEAAARAAGTSGEDMWGWTCENNTRSELFNNSGSPNCPSPTTSLPADNGVQGKGSEIRGTVGVVFLVSVVFAVLTDTL